MDALSAAALALGLALAAGDASAHEPYTKWLMPNGGKCCSDLERECRRVASRYNDAEGRFEIWHGGAWAPVPQAAVLNMPSPDGDSHACISADGARVFCFVNGMPKI